MSKEREALEGLREAVNASAYGRLPEKITNALRIADEALAAYPVGVPSIPPRGRDNHGDRTQALYEAADAVYHALVEDDEVYALRAIAAIRALHGALAIEEKSSTLCQNTPEGKEQE